jgi:bifunctional non-homologous end joining protein LigD
MKTRGAVKLKEYAKKRDFSRTPEPSADESATARAEPRFCVQRHQATRLHYDLRLEIDATLKSWAVPKGPSLDPSVKALAVQVEDHPIDYGEFEGNIPKGNYGAGSVMLWDRGSFQVLEETPPEEQLKRGDLKIHLRGEKLRGAFALVRMKNRGKGNEWLLIKKKDTEARSGWKAEDYPVSVKTGRTQEEIAADLPPKQKRTRKRPASPSMAGIPGAERAPIPTGVTPMLASLVSTPPTDGGWLYEVKWDGVRALARIEDGKVRLISRNGNSFDRQFPELTVLPRQVSAQTALLDGEIVVLDDKGRAKFELIQPRLGITSLDAAAQGQRRAPTVFFAFDLLYCDGYDLRQATLTDRRKVLSEILKPSERLRYSESFSEDAETILEAARAAGLEGVVAKRATSLYQSRRSRDWLKIKLTGSEDFVICGYTKGERDYFGALVLGSYQGEDLVWAGNVGTGFDRSKMKDIFERLEPLMTRTAPFSKPARIPAVTWVRPEICCTVKFLEWTREGRLRAPVFVALKSNSEVPGEQSGPSGSALLAPDEKEAFRDIEGRRLKFTNLNKLYYPRDGITKRDLINYYDAVAHLILPYLRNRPLSLKRYPDGIEGPFFFQKDIDEKYPDWLRLEPIHSEHRNAPIRYVVADDRATLLYLANLGCIDHNPWMSRAGSIEHPDFVLVDLDAQQCPFDKIVEAALLVKSILDRLGLEGYPKTTGGDGMHVYIPLEPRYSYEETRGFAEILAHLSSAAKPDLFTTPRSVSKRRKGRVYFDYQQNSSSKTISAPYVLRAYPGAPVATPLDWSEVRPGLSPGEFNIRTAVERFSRKGDLFRGVLDHPQSLEKALDRVDMSS